MPANEWVDLLIRMNLVAAVAIVVVAAVRKPVRARFGANLAYGLWLLPPLAAVAALIPARVITVGAPPLAQPPVFAGPATQVSPTPIPFDWNPVIIGVWLAGALVALGVMAVLQHRFGAEVRRGAIGPAVVGVVSPRIVTPADFAAKFDAEEQTLVLAHEQTHIARQDSRINGAAALIQCAFWFNPLIHLAAHLMRIDQEMACDAVVATRFPQARGAYARALMKAQLAIRPLPLGCYWPSGTEHPLMERIAMLKANEPSRRRRIAGISILALTCAGAGAAAWAAQPPRTIVETVADTRNRPFSITADRGEIRPGGPASFSNIFSGGDPERQARANALLGLPADAESRVICDLYSDEGVSSCDYQNGPGGTRVAVRPAQLAALQAQGLLPGPPPPGFVDITAQNEATYDTASPVTVNGVIETVFFVNPSARINVRDTATGQLWVINTDTPNALIRAGGTRASLARGTPITARAYRAKDGNCDGGCQVFASPISIYSNGEPLFPNAGPASLGDPNGPPAADFEDISPFTNSVVREGATADGPATAAPRPPTVFIPSPPPRPPFNNSVVREGAAADGLATAAPRPPTVFIPNPPPRPSVIARPDWIEQPSVQDIQRVYPDRALRLERDGTVRMECTVVATGELTACNVVAESPTALGFGDAALSLAPLFKMQATTADGAPVGGARVQIPIGFRTNPAA